MHGAELAELAEKRGSILAFEAAVAGGIPIIKALREGLVGNRVARLYGILNGTCNYILTTMRETGRDFDVVLAEAQAAGYAEADPSFDVDGIDAAHKLAVLTGAAFGAKVNFAGVHVEGIRRVTSMDIEFAEELGYRIKLLGLARETKYGIEQRVHPCMVSLEAPIAHIEGVFNAVAIEGDFVGKTMFQGRGAGQGPTASAVVADIVDVARGRHMPAFVVPAARLADKKTSPMDRHVGAYYMRLMVQDRAGAMRRRQPKPRSRPCGGRLTPCRATALSGRGRANATRRRCFISAKKSVQAAPRSTSRSTRSRAPPSPPRACRTASPSWRWRRTATS